MEERPGVTAEGDCPGVISRDADVSFARAMGLAGSAWDFFILMRIMDPTTSSPRSIAAQLSGSTASLFTSRISSPTSI